MGVLLASSGFLLAWVVSDIKHSLFTQVLIVMGYSICLFGVKKRIAGSSLRSHAKRSRTEAAELMLSADVSSIHARPGVISADAPAHDAKSCRNL